MGRPIEVIDKFATDIEAWASEVATRLGLSVTFTTSYRGDNLEIAEVGQPGKAIPIPRSLEWECASTPDDMKRRVQELVEACLRISHRLSD